MLRGVVIGFRDATLSSEGLDTFKLGYEFLRDELAMRRDYLERHARDAAPAPGDNAAVVKAARSV
jgi:hypothetical protein